jgi:RNA polymerase sigma-70 factor (ECF subfamily)
MDQNDWLANRFNENRSHLRAVAYRMLGSLGEAEDAVQETWLRLSRADAGAVDNLGGWLTTVVARVCLDMLRSRKTHAEQSTDPQLAAAAGGTNPESELLLADSLGPALLVLLETLSPPERVAFVLHDLFDVPFEEIAPIVGRSPAAARQLASRARRRVRGGDAARETDLIRQREIVGAFFAASRNGDFNALLAVLAPDVVLTADGLAVRTAAATKWAGEDGLGAETRGAVAVAETFKGRAAGALPALIDGAAGAVWASGGKLLAAFVFTIEEGEIVALDLVMEPERLRDLVVERNDIDN